MYSRIIGLLSVSTLLMLVACSGVVDGKEVLIAKQMISKNILSPESINWSEVEVLLDSSNNYIVFAKISAVNAFNVRLSGSYIAAFRVNDSNYTSDTNFGVLRCDDQFSKEECFKFSRAANFKSENSKKNANPVKSFTDSRDGTIYKYTLIGGVYWMTENLKYKVDGESACDRNDETRCQRYGRLYTWYGAVGGRKITWKSEEYIQGACPEGWRLPTESDVNLLVREAKRMLEVDKLESAYFKGGNWTYSSAYDDLIGFNAVESPLSSENFKEFSSYDGIEAAWWSSSYDSENTPFNLEILSPVVSDVIDYGYQRSKTDGLQIRCVSKS